MNWLLLPTDNLHKFCAVLGLILIFGPLAGLFYLVHYTGELARTASLGTTKTEIEISNLEEIGEAIETQLDNGLKLDRKRLEERREQLKVIRLSGAENRSANDKALKFSNYSDRAFFFALISIVIGGQLALSGFKGWAQLSEHEKNLTTP